MVEEEEDGVLGRGGRRTAKVCSSSFSLFWDHVYQQTETAQSLTKVLQTKARKAVKKVKKSTTKKKLQVEEEEEEESELSEEE